MSNSSLALSATRLFGFLHLHITIFLKSIYHNQKLIYVIRLLLKYPTRIRQNMKPLTDGGEFYPITRLNHRLWGYISYFAVGTSSCKASSNSVSSSREEIGDCRRKSARSSSLSPSLSLLIASSISEPIRGSRNLRVIVCVKSSG